MADPELKYCKANVWPPDGRGGDYECSRKAKRDGYCVQHHPDSVRARRKEAAARYNEKWRAIEEARKQEEEKVEEAVLVRIRAAVAAERENDKPLTWLRIAEELEQVGFGVGMLDPRGESQSGLEALMYKLAAAIRKEPEDAKA